MEEPEPIPQILSPCSSGRNSSSGSISPEFEFWMVRNPSFPQPDLLSADELFSGGVLLPLHHLRVSGETPSIQQELTHEEPVSDQVPGPEPSTTDSADVSVSSPLTSSKRWRDIFKKTDKRISSPPQANINNNGADHTPKEKDNGAKEKNREKKNGGVGAKVGASTAELNINIWPFSRSRSAGNGGTRPRSAAPTRKVSSAPCSRSNSAGESKSRKWPSSPNRAGVHLGRSSPVWHVRLNAAGGRSSDAVTMPPSQKVLKKDGDEGRRKIPSTGRGGASTKAKVLSLNVPMCIGYRHHLSCRSDENSAIRVASSAAGDVIGGDNQIGGGIAGEGVRRSNLLNIRGLFTKKVY